MRQRDSGGTTRQSPDRRPGRTGGGAAAPRVDRRADGPVAPEVADRRLRRAVRLGPRLRDFAPTVRRAVENETIGDPSTQTETKQFFISFEAAVRKAYQFATTVPSLHPFGELNGYTKHWLKIWNEFLAGGRPKLMAATFGYVIESLVSSPTTGFMPKPPSGHSVDVQVTSGGTRPDLVLRLTKGTHHVAWLDLTAAKSVDHIYLKDDWGSKVKNYAEVTYPSLDPGTIAFMRQNKDNKGVISEEEYRKRAAVAQEEYQKNKVYWLKLGEQFAYSNLGKKVSASKETQALNPAIPRKFILDALTEFFKPDGPIEEKMVPSILAAMGVGSMPWGYTIGYSASEKAGEAWLLDNPPPG